MKNLFLPIFAFFSFTALACDGGLALNKRRISIPEFSIFANDMTEKEFRDGIKAFQNFFEPVLERDHNMQLVVIGSWASNTVNAFAERPEKNKAYVTIYGGLARHKSITKDGFTAALCHELGHHLGGYPKKSTNRWSSAEGQSDYYATMKCLRKFWEKADNIAIMRDVAVPAKLKEECAVTHVRAEGQALCHRMGLAGKSVALMIQDLDHDSLEPKFETPDDLVVRTINYMHPFAQCRLDTYFQGAICPASESVEFSDTDEKQGACHPALGDTRGLRPRCWYFSRN